MKKSRIIVPALAMLVMSTAATVTGTVAWFSINKTVVATGMKVKAVGESSLVIKGSDTGSVYSSTGTSTKNATSMKPSTSFDGVNFAKLGSAVKVENAASGAATWSGASGAFQASDLVTVNPASDGADIYYTTVTYSIKSLEQTKDVYVKSVSSSTTGTQKLYKALRVSVKMGDGTTKIFNPNGGANQSAGVGKYNTTTSAWSLDTPTYTSANTTNAALGSATANTEYTVTVNVWFEGQDTTCFSDNVDACEYFITLEFTTDSPSSAS